MGELLVPDAETRGFVFASFEWLLSGFGGLAHFLEQASLITPTLSDFPVDASLDGPNLLADYFGFVREHAKVDRELCFELVGGRPALMRLSEVGRAPLPVGYPDEAADEPELFIAYAARGLHHYVVQTHPRSPPGGWSMLGGVAELAAVFSGFGIFMANTAYAPPLPEQRLLRWAPQPRWTLSEAALSYALAVFGWMEEIPDAHIMGYLRPSPRAFYRAAVRDLRRRGAELGELRGTLRLPHVGPYR